MARARSIKPGFFSNDALVELPFETRLLFIGLWTVADKEGRLMDRPKKIKMELFPADDVDCDIALDQLAEKGFVSRYIVAGVRYVQVSNWTKHQNPHMKEADSVIPPPPEAAPEIPVQAPEVPARAGPLTSSLTLDSGLPIPDSGLRTVGPHTPPPDVPRGTIPIFSGWQFVDQRMRPVYPRGTFRHTHWLNAAKMVEQIVEGGESADVIAANAAAYCAQVEASGNVGTKFVMAPTTFLTDGNWRGPFPLPAAAQKPREESPMERMRRLNNPDASRVIEHG